MGRGKGNVAPSRGQGKSDRVNETEYGVQYGVEKATVQGGKKYVMYARESRMSVCLRVVSSSSCFLAYTQKSIG